MHSACAVLYSCVWLNKLYHIVPHYLIHGKIFEKKENLNVKCVSWIFPTMFTPYIFHFENNSKTYFHKCTYHMSSCKVPVIIVRYKSKFNFFRKILKYQISSKSFQWESCLTLANPCVIIRFKQFNQQEAKVSQVYYLTFICAWTCFGRLPAHLQEHTTALGASGFSVGGKRIQRCWSWSGQTTTNNATTAALQR